MKKLPKIQKTVRIVKRLTRTPRGWIRNAILGEEEERAHIIKKSLLYLTVALFLGTIFHGILKSGAEPLGDLKISDKKAAQEALSPYKAVPYREQGNTAGNEGQHGKGNKSIRYVGLELFQRPAVPIPSGLLVKAKLVTGASNGPVEAKTIEDGQIKGVTIVNSGTVFRGSASSSQDRLIIRFSKFKKEDGTEESVQAQAYDLDDKTPGLKTSRVWHEAKKFLFGSGLNFAGGLAEGLQDTSVKNGVAVKDSSLKNGLLNGARDAARSQSQEIISDMRSQPTPLELPPDTTFYVGFE